MKYAHKAYMFVRHMHLNNIFSLVSLSSLKLFCSYCYITGPCIIYIYIHTHTHIYIYIYIYIFQLADGEK